METFRNLRAEFFDWTELMSPAVYNSHKKKNDGDDSSSDESMLFNVAPTKHADWASKVVIRSTLYLLIGSLALLATNDLKSVPSLMLLCLMSFLTVKALLNMTQEQIYNSIPDFVLRLTYWVSFGFLAGLVIV